MVITSELIIKRQYQLGLHILSRRSLAFVTFCSRIMGSVSPAEIRELLTGSTLRRYVVIENTGEQIQYVPKVGNVSSVVKMFIS
jgi:hypothetical protein